MKLYLVRHGQAQPKDADPERPLTEKGVRTVRRIADFLKAAGAVSVAEIRHSDKLRAKQTAETIAERLQISVPMGGVSSLEPLAPVSEVADALPNVTTDLMLVGHLPHLNRLASYLVSGEERLEAFMFSEGGTLCLSRTAGERQGWEHAPSWTVQWMVNPELLP